VLVDLFSRLPVEPFRIDHDVDRWRHYRFALDPKFPFHVRQLSYPAGALSSPSRFNWHERLEIFVDIAGWGSFRMGDRLVDFGPGDVIVVDNLKLHGVLSYRGPERLAAVITFMPELVSNPLSYPCDSSYLFAFYSRPAHLDPAVRAKDKASADVHSALGNMLRCYLNEAASMELRRAGCKVYLLQALYHLTAHFGLTDLPAADFNSHRRASLQFGRLYEYLQENYADRITVSRAADMLGLSDFQFMKFFRRATGTTFVTYLARLRLAHAHRLLGESDRSIAAIAAEVGFSDQSYFDRRFRQYYKQSPREVRALAGSFKSPGNSTRASAPGGVQS
jgi:AraC-like DNA-binding protein/mannose-6-phosphate isomerase-like protein (cupin superfamily)